ncbi:MAG: hypothetical protein SVG88_07270, partial [Halobacteriales archaeon]|nr:hypothetical protein [Halobacteriales archaeon]
MRQGGWIVAAVTIALLFVIGSVPVAADGPVADNRTTVRPDPDTDVIGWEAGYWHNESIAVDQTDGLSDAELDRYIARSMARVEFLRDREFKRSVSVTIQSRTEFQSRLDDRTRSDRY